MPHTCTLLWRCTAVMVYDITGVSPGEGNHSTARREVVWYGVVGCVTTPELD